MQVSVHIDEIARVCHEALNAIDEADSKNITVSWPNLSYNEKETVLEGVEYYLLHPLATPEMVHNNWVAEQAAAGWKFSAGTINELEKTHPQMVPFTKLHGRQKAQATVFRSIVLSLTA